MYTGLWCRLVTGGAIHSLTFSDLVKHHCFNNSVLQIDDVRNVHPELSAGNGEGQTRGHARWIRGGSEAREEVDM